jgi:hypothetical protein
MIKKTLLFVVVFLVFIAAIVYFVRRFSDVSFRDNAMGNLFATIIGVMVGIPIGLEINRRQQAEIERKENENKQKKKREEFKLFFDRIEDELQHNENQLEKLNNTLALSAQARKDMWELANAIVDSFSFRANDDFYSTGLQLFLPENIEVRIYTAFIELRRLFHNIRAALPAHVFYNGYSTGGQEQANKLFQTIKDDATRIADFIHNTLDDLAEFRAKGMLQD